MINIGVDYDNIYRRYYRVLLLNVASKRNTAIDAEAVAQEALLRLWAKRDECRFENDEQLGAWLMRAARFIVLEHLRAHQSAESLDDHENTADSSDPIEQHIEDIRTRQHLHKIEQELSEHDWLIFKMVFIECRPHAECAAELKIKEVSLRSSLSRLRKRLRPYFDGMFDEEK